MRVVPSKSANSLLREQNREMSREWIQNSIVEVNKNKVTSMIQNKIQCSYTKRGSAVRVENWFKVNWFKVTYFSKFLTSSFLLIMVVN